MRIPLADIRKVIAEGDFAIRAANADGHVGRATLERMQRRGQEVEVNLATATHKPHPEGCGPKGKHSSATPTE